jgi:hypothetical protein
LTVGITRMYCSSCSSIVLTCHIYSGNENHLNPSLILVWRLCTANFYCIYPQTTPRVLLNVRRKYFDFSFNALT